MSLEDILKKENMKNKKSKKETMENMKYSKNIFERTLNLPSSPNLHL